MQYRVLGKTNIKVSEISLGTWQVGGIWGSGFDDKKADAIINKAIDGGVNFIDTADVYENGLSEKAVGRVVKNRSEKIYIASKCGKQIDPHTNENYTVKLLRQYVEDSLSRLKVDTLDLIQLHCPPTGVLQRDEVFGLFDDLKTEGKILNLGVSVETVEEAFQSISYSNVTTIQIIFNLFRQKPAKLFFEKAKEKKIGIIARVPLASGLLTGKFNALSNFEPTDHRSFNRNGEQFDKGETFSGIEYGLGLRAVEKLKLLFPGTDNLAPIALQWILTHPEVSTIIPGASKVEQVESNLSVYNRPDLSAYHIGAMNEIYEQMIASEVEPFW